MVTNTRTPIRLSDAAVIPLRTLDPAEPLDDLEWLDEVVGEARVVAIGESAHYNAETYLLRHRLLRYLVERHGFGAYAMETGFTEGGLTDSRVRGGGERPGHVLAEGITSLMGLWTQMRAQVEWIRGHNHDAARPVGFHGVDLGGGNVSLLPGLNAVIAYLAQADPELTIDPGVREAAVAFAAPSAFSAPAAFSAYAGLAPSARDALTAGLAELAARMAGRRLDYVARTSVEAYERALRSLHLVTVLDTVVRAMARGDQQTAMSNRDAAIADTVEWVLGRHDRIVLAAHNGHIQRWPGTLPGMPPMAPAGLHLADRLGEDYVVIGTTTGTGRTLNDNPEQFYAGTLFTDLGAPRPGSLDALMADAHDGPFAIDLRRLSPADTAAFQTVSEQRMGTFYCDINPLDAYDAIVHLPRVTAAEPDDDALAASPREVQETFARWERR
ncbi:erythromycin esterase family protein [Saccharothrix longispora]|uniref:erythromycin esterase family protein n=1 Tax=Saccharothrix longispora TaxID=33920 RepID=UPI0028FD5C8E|nr:erythromycin esterase family protein [Saccharothrix longispora]MDU0294238.1 erythromycin esterase family protein [Saccharothrix longispora]